MHIFDYTFLENTMLPADLVSVTSAISAFNAISSERQSRYSGVYIELEAIAKVQSVKCSNAIEGIITTDARIKEIVNKSSAPLNHDEEEIAGYRDALNEIHTLGENGVFSEELIKQLHHMLYSHSGGSGGEYKTENNLIMEIAPDGTRAVRFNPIPAKDTKAAMEQLIFAYMDARDNPKINKLLLVPCVILDFLCIHPFADGNGRVSRLLSLLLLYKAGFNVGKYVSFEEQINNEKAWYYHALKESSAGWNENSNSYVPFMNDFLSMLYRCYKELDKRFSAVNGKKITKKQRIEDTVLNSILPISKKEICEFLPDVSATTVEEVLGRMVKDGRINKIGQSHNTKYANAKFFKGI